MTVTLLLQINCTGGYNSQSVLCEWDLRIDIHRTRLTKKLRDSDRLLQVCMAQTDSGLYLLYGCLMPGTYGGRNKCFGGLGFGTILYLLTSIIIM